MDTASIIGTTAACIGTITFLQQVVQCVKTKNTKSISLHTYLIILCNTVLWTIYGFMRQDFPIILVNFFIFISSLIIVMCKLKYG